MPKPLALSDGQITTIMQLCRPLASDQRATFLEMIATKLNGHREIGDGALYQLCRELQRKLFDPPETGFDSHRTAKGSKLTQAPPIDQDRDRRRSRLEGR
jgi:hypothetical protein